MFFNRVYGKFQLVNRSYFQERGDIITGIKLGGAGDNLIQKSSE